MPIIKSAKKKMRKDSKRTMRNQKMKDSLKKLVKQMRKTPSKETLQKTTSSLDRAAKINLIHINKAARLKSRLSKLIPVSR